MEGRSLNDAKAAQCTATGRSTCPGTQSSLAHVAMSQSAPPAANTVESIVVNSKTYYAGPPPTPAASDFAGTAFLSNPLPITDANEMTFDHHMLEAYSAFNGPIHASLDWAQYSRTVSPGDNNPSPVAFSASRIPATDLDTSLFILNMGATCHILPIHADFKKLRPIAPHPITGVGGARVYATGMGSIELCIAGGLKVMLDNAVYVPASTVRLVSVLELNTREQYTSHFDSDKCWVTNKSGATIMCSTVLCSRHLYTLSLQSPHVEHTKPKSSIPLSESSMALLSTRVPDLETWHRRLGHCSTDAIIDMAHKGVVKGMRVDLSTALPRCNHCILGKQTHSPVPKMREGIWASCPLEWVYIDLYGPMPCASRSGHLYSMNLIDDFSSYVWSLPLRLKDESVPALQL